MKDQVLPNHSSETLMKYGRKLFDTASRLHRNHPTDQSLTLVQDTANALIQADKCFPGASPDFFTYAAHVLNSSHRHLNEILKLRGLPLFSLTGVEPEMQRDDS